MYKYYSSSKALLDKIVEKNRSKGAAAGGVSEAVGGLPRSI